MFCVEWKIFCMMQSEGNMKLFWYIGAIIFFILAVICFRAGRKNKRLQEEINELSQIQNGIQVYYSNIENMSKELYDLKQQIAGRQTEQKTEIITKFTGDYFIDYILEKRQKEMKVKDIVFHIQTDKLNEDICVEADAISLFDNLLENAIEACERVGFYGGQERDFAMPFVRLFIYEREGSYLTKYMPQYFSDFFVKEEMYHVILLENSKLAKERPLDNKFETLKQQRELHGSGMRIIKGIIEKYKGRAEYHDSGNMFSSCIIFPIRREENDI